jgi:hypothetical protein
VNLMKVTDAAIPFRQVAAELHAADVVFGNLECCLHLPARRSHDTEGFFADPQIGGEALRLGGFHAVGVANNVNYGADNIAASLAVLDRLGIPHTGAGANLAAAGCGLASCNAARCIGRRTTKLSPIRPASP